MKKLILIVLCTLVSVTYAQTQNLIYKEFQDYDSLTYSYKPGFSVFMPCEIDFDNSIITIGSKDASHAVFKLESFNMSNNCLIYHCINTELDKRCLLILYVYGDYRYLEVVYTTKNKFKYRIRTSESLTYK